MTAAAVGAQCHADVVECGGEGAVDGDGLPAGGDVPRRVCDDSVAAEDLQARAAGACGVEGDLDAPLRGPRVAQCDQRASGAAAERDRWHADASPPRMTTMPPSRVTSIASIESLRRPAKSPSRFRVCLWQFEQRADRAVGGDLPDALIFADQERPVGEASQVLRQWNQGPRPATVVMTPSALTWRTRPGEDFGDEIAAVLCQQDVAGPAELRRGCRAAIAAIAADLPLSAAGDRGDGCRRGRPAGLAGRRRRRTRCFHRETASGTRVVPMSAAVAGPPSPDVVSL